MTLPDDLLTALRRAADAPRLLVVSDFDGTLAPFSADPLEVAPIDGSIEALTELAGLPGTRSALVSGRAFDVLSELTGHPESVFRVGSHGAEYGRAMTPLTTDERALFDRIESEVRAIVGDTEGARIELKPSAVVTHVRAVADADHATDLLDRILAVPGSHPGVHVTGGKAIVEIAVREASKGTALRSLASEHRADVTVFLGDDATDELGFEAMTTTDVAIKVGGGETAAGYRIDDVPAVLEVITHLLALRHDRA